MKGIATASLIVAALVIGWRIGNAIADKRQGRK